MAHFTRDSIFRLFTKKQSVKENILNEKNYHFD